MRDEQKAEGELPGELDALRRRVSELEQAQSAPRHSEKQFKDLFDNAIVGIYRTTPDGRIIMANSAFVRMLGFSSFEELAEKKVDDEGFAPGYPRPTFKDLIEKKGKVIGFESAFLRRDGTTIFVRENARVVLDLSGRALYYEGVVEDITEIKKREEELKESEQRFRSIFDNAVDGIVLADVESKRFSIGNKAFLEMLGYSAEEIENLGVMDIHPKESLPYVTEQFQKQSRREISLARDLPVKRKDGSVFYADVNAFPMTLDGKSHLAGIFRDVTERKQAEEVCRLSEEKFAKAFNSSPAAIFITTLKEGRFIDLNESAIKVFGYTREDVVGHTAKELNMWASYNDRDIVVQSIRRGNAVRDMEARFRRKSGEVFDCIISVDIINIGGTECLISTIVDITERKKMEEGLKQYQLIVESAQDPMLFKDLKSRYIVANKTALQALGLPREQVIGKNDSEVLRNKDEARMAIEDNNVVFRTGKPSETVRQFTLADGRSHWFHIVKVPHFDDKGKVVGLVSVGRDVTKLKKTEDELREEKLRYQTLFESAPVGIGVSTPEGQVLECNDAMLKMLGYSETEVKQINLRDTYKDPQRRQELLKRLQRDGFIRDFEVQLKRKDGTAYYASLTIAPFTFNGQNVLLAVQENITERKKAEDALQKSEESGRAILDATTESVLLIDKQGTILTINKTGARRFGRSVEELVGTNVWDVALGLIPPDLIKSRREQIDKVIHSGKPLRFEDRRKEKIYDNNIYPIFDEKGQVTRLAIFARDITEQRKAEEMLRELKYRYQTLFESTPVGIGVSTPEGQVLECNDAMLKVMGYSLAELKQINLRDIYQDPQQRQELLKRLERDGFVRNFEVQLKRKDGTLYYANLTMTPFTFKGQNVLLAVQEDITERKQAQEMLNSYREKMIRAEHLASLGALGATLAHELTQPLTVLTLTIENALTKLKTMSSAGTIAEKLKDSLNEISNVTSTVERFRNYARKSSEGIAEEVNLEPIAERTMRLLSESARRARVTLHLKGLDKLPPVYSNEKNIEQVFFALVENAIQAADGKKGRQVIIGGAVKGEYVELQFSDNCGGIAPENLGKIFEPFFTTKPHGEGTGLGLCIVEHVVSRTGGKVRVESKAGKGSTFFVTLPINAGEKP